MHITDLNDNLDEMGGDAFDRIVAKGPIDDLVRGHVYDAKSSYGHKRHYRIGVAHGRRAERKRIMHLKKKTWFATEGLVYDDGGPGHKTPFTGVSDDADAMKYWKEHNNNHFILQHFHKHGTALEKMQAAKELPKAESKMKFWERHPRFDQKEAMKHTAEMKKQWSTVKEDTSMADMNTKGAPKKLRDVLGGARYKGNTQDEQDILDRIAGAAKHIPDPAGNGDEVFNGIKQSRTAVNRAGSPTDATKYEDWVDYGEDFEEINEDELEEAYGSGPKSVVVMHRDHSLDGVTYPHMAERAFLGPKNEKGYHTLTQHEAGAYKFGKAEADRKIHVWHQHPEARAGGSEHSGWTSHSRFKSYPARSDEAVASDHKAKMELQSKAHEHGGYASPTYRAKMNAHTHPAFRTSSVSGRHEEDI